MILTGRLYDNKGQDCNYKILVDRLWPRGISKNKAFWDEWLRDIAPSNELRKWFGHDPGKWQEFRKRYLTELSDKNKEIQKIRDLEKKHESVILLYGSTNTEFNHANVLRDFILQKEK